MKFAYNSGLHRYSIFVVCWTLLLLVAGALVTSKDAALSVADWPKSFGTWFPSWAVLNGGALFEHTHRVVAFGLGILTLILSVALWVTEKRLWLKWFSVIAVLGIAVQAVLGGQVVIRLLHYWLPVIHACFAQLVFAALISIAVFTSRWWVEEKPMLKDAGSPGIHTIALLNSAVIYFQVILGAGFRHREISVKPHVIGAFVVLGMISWTAATLRRRFGACAEFVKARKMLHGIFGLQFLLGFAALWSRVTTADAPQPMPVMVALTVLHTVIGAILFAISVLVVLICYRLVPRRGQVTVSAERQVTA